MLGVPQGLNQSRQQPDYEIRVFWRSPAYGCRSAGNRRPMHSILDVDLDYFNLMPNAADRFTRLLDWAACPVSIVVERHNQAFARWKSMWQANGITPSHILHVDEHHDMMDQRRQTNIANFMCHAMRIWPKCRVHWLVQHPIDSPAMWLEDETWNSLRRRFSYGPNRPARWPKPDVVSVCTSPDFLVPDQAAELMDVLSRFVADHHKDKTAEQLRL
jgi:hypothetical protein